MKWEVKRAFENTTTQGVKWYNISLQCGNGNGEPTMYLNVKRFFSPKKGTYFTQFPQTIYNEQEAKQTNYEQGVEKHFFGNTEFLKIINEAIKEYYLKENIDYNTMGYSNEGSYIKIEPKEPEVIDGLDIDLDNLKF